MYNNNCELNTSLSPEPTLKTTPSIHKGRILCIICFTGTLQRHIKRAGIEKITEIFGSLRKNFAVEKI